MNKTHNPERIIDANDFKKLINNQDQLIDFLPNIQKNSKTDLLILKKWKLYFIKNDVPFIVEDLDNHLILWKAGILID